MVNLKWNIRHDYFNLITLPIVCGYTIYYLYFNSLVNINEYYIFLIYILLDTLWLIIIPSSVSSPSTIIIHHIICIIGWNILFLNKTYFYWLSCGLLVEINTWLLIAKRNINSVILNILFYMTWVLIRLVMYPVILIMFFKEFYKVTIDNKSILNDSFIILILMFLINCLNFKWTYDLFSKPLKIITFVRTKAETENRGL